MRRTLLLLSLTLLISGCALSPQTLELRPETSVSSSQRGNNQPVVIYAIDSRGQDAFGTRGGAYPNTALIRPAGSTQEPIADSVRAGLQQLGFNTVSADDDATRLELRLKKLDYVPEAGSIVNEVTLSLALDAEASRGDHQHTASYRSSVTHQQPFTPTPAQNERMINDLLSQVLERLLQDDELLNFLAGQVNQ